MSGTTLALEAILKDRPHDPREDRVLIYMLFDLIEALSKRAFPNEDMRVVMSARGQPGTYSEHPVGMWDVYWTMARD